MENKNTNKRKLKVSKLEKNNLQVSKNLSKFPKRNTHPKDGEKKVKKVDIAAEEKDHNNHMSKKEGKLKIQRVSKLLEIRAKKAREVAEEEVIVEAEAQEVASEETEVIEAEEALTEVNTEVNTEEEEKAEANTEVEDTEEELKEKKVVTHSNSEKEEEDLTEFREEEVKCDKLRANNNHQSRLKQSE